MMLDSLKFAAISALLFSVHDFITNIYFCFWFLDYNFST